MFIKGMTLERKTTQCIAYVTDVCDSKITLFWILVREGDGLFNFRADTSKFKGTQYPLDCLSISDYTILHVE